MAKLDEPTKLFIVQALACFDTPQQVADAVREEFAIEVSRMQVQAYDPTKRKGGEISKKLKAVFERTRQRFLDEIEKVPIASQTYRLRNLQRLHEKAQARGNMALAAALLEQAAKEVGGAYTNRREHSGPGGGPIPVKNENVTAMSDADLERIAAGGGS
jgi:hypothetical protein